MTSAHPRRSDSLVLADKACNGDADALGILLKRYEDRVRRIVRVRLGTRLRNRLESMDIVQEAFAIAVRKIRELELNEEADLLKWLTRVATRQIGEAAEHHGAAMRDQGKEVPITGTADVADGTPPAWQQMEDVEAREQLDSALAKLPEHYREIILLRDYHGGSWAFVAKEMGSPTPDAAMKQYHRAWIRLREALGIRD